MHLDQTATSLEPFAGLDRLSTEGQLPWAVLADPEGVQFCVFTAAAVLDYRLEDIVVEAVDPVAVGSWWAEVRLVHDDSGHTRFDDVPGAPFGVGCVPVPETRTVKNRIHWDVTLNAGVTIDDLVGRVARLARAQDEQIGWTVMADPEGTSSAPSVAGRADDGRRPSPPAGGSRSVSPTAVAGPHPGGHEARSTRAHSRGWTTPASHAPDPVAARALAPGGCRQLESNTCSSP